VKLVTKLTFAFFLVACCVIAISSVVRVQRELEVFHDDLVLDHSRLAHALAKAVGAVRSSDGPDAAHAFVLDARTQDDALEIHWVCDVARPSAASHVACEEITAIAPGAELTHIAPDGKGQNRLYTWVRIPAPELAGAIEVSEPTTNEAAHAQQVLYDSVVSAVSMVAAFAVTAFVLGTWLVGRPTSNLTALARRIGRGEFGEPIKPSSSDELGALAGEMNMMARKLESATKQAADESAARIATLEQLRHVDRLTTVGELASGVAHELGTPLNVIELRASMIASGEVLGAPAKDAARAIVEASEQMTRTVGQLLAFARRHTLERAPTDIARIVRQTVELVAPFVRKQRVEVTVDADEGAIANVDELQVQQALTNLVMNAVQAMPDGGRVRLSVRRSNESAKQKGPVVQVRVEDDGPGIAPDNLERVFDPFFTTKDVGRGTGLGLSIADKIVSDHGGWITVSSEQGKGAVFDVFLPAEVSP
jgi:two-component system, NtrC family, sensor kinase